MKKITVSLILAMFMLLGPVLGQNSADAKNSAAPGQLIKGQSYDTVYYVGEDGKRYVFPNANIYFSWYDDFSDVEEISDGELADLPLGGNVRYRPGALLVKIQTDPKVYAVSNDGDLHWVKSEALAKSMYGSNWNKLVDDVPDSFFTNYRISTAIESESDYDPSEEEENYPSISYNRGFKKMEKRMEQNLNNAEKKCQNFEKAINNLQKRLQRWGLELPGFENNFVSECVDKVQSRYQNQQVTICHIPAGNPSARETITISKSALRTHLRQGDRLGTCRDHDNGDDDTTAPAFSNITATPNLESAVVAWTTNESADSRVIYDTDQLDSANTSYLTKSSSVLAASHSLVITDLATGTLYYYKVVSTDNSGNSATSSQKSFTTLTEADNTAPVITDAAAAPGLESATITWTTDESAKSKVIYDTDQLDSANNDYAAKSSSLLTTAHSLELTNLATGTQYYYRVISEDSSGNIATSSQLSFVTLTVAPDITAPVIANIGSTTATSTAQITWTTNEPATSAVTYSQGHIADGSTVTVSDSNKVSIHTVDLIGLDEDTLYYYIVESVDAADNTATSSELSFTTGF